MIYRIDFTFKAANQSAYNVIHNYLSQLEAGDIIANVNIEVSQWSADSTTLSFSGTIFFTTSGRTKGQQVATWLNNNADKLQRRSPSLTGLVRVHECGHDSGAACEPPLIELAF